MAYLGYDLFIICQNVERETFLSPGRKCADLKAATRSVSRKSVASARTVLRSAAPSLRIWVLVLFSP